MCITSVDIVTFLRFAGDHFMHDHKCVLLFCYVHAGVTVTMYTVMW